MTASPYAMRFTAEQWAAAGTKAPPTIALPEPSCSAGDLFRTHPERVLFDPVGRRRKRDRDREIV